MGSFVGADANGANVTTLTGVSWPAHSGDDLAILVWTFLNTSTHTDPSGFTLVDTLDDGTCRSRVYKRIPADMTGSESGDVSLVCGTINRQSAVLYVVSGFTDVGGSASFAETVTGTSHDCPQVTFTGNCNTLVAVSERLSTGTTNATAPSGYTEHTGSEFGTGGSGGTYTGVADDGLTTAVGSPVNPGAWTGHVSGGTAVTWTIALTPSSSGVTISPTGIASEEAFGTAAVVATLTTSPTGISSAEAFGAPVIAATLTVSPGGIAPAEAFGIPTVLMGGAVVPDGIVSTEAFGAPTVLTTLTVVPAGVASAESFGAVTISTALVTSPDGIPTAEAVGSPVVATMLTVAPAGVISGEAFGTAAVTTTVTVSPAGIASAETFGTLTISTLALRDITVVASIRNNHVTGGVRLTNLVAEVRSNHITGGLDVPRNMLTGSVEYVTAEVTFVGETGATIASVTGQVKITSDDIIPSSWDNADVTERTDVNGGALLALKKLHTAGAAGTYRLWAKVSDNPEVPVLLCGSFDVR